MLNDYLEHECLKADDGLNDLVADRLKLYPWLTWRLTFLGGVRVVDLPPPASGQRLSEPCAQCGFMSSVILISSHLLLSLRQLLLLFVETIESWEVSDSQLSVGSRAPNLAEVEEYQRLSAECQGKSQLNPEAFHEFERRWGRLDANVAAIFGPVGDLAWLWYVGHEAAHAYDSTRHPLPAPEMYGDIRSAIASDVAKHEPDDYYRRRWVAELTADVIAVHMLWGAVNERLGLTDSGKAVPLVAAEQIAGAVSIVCETLFQIERGTFLTLPDHDERKPDHPSARSRYLTMMSSLCHLSGRPSPDDFDFLARVLGSASLRYGPDAPPGA